MKLKIMILTEEQKKEFEKAVKPLMKYLAENHHPHVTVIVDGNAAELLEGIALKVVEVSQNTNKVAEPTPTKGLLKT